MCSSRIISPSTRHTKEAEIKVSIKQFLQFEKLHSESETKKKTKQTKKQIGKIYL